MRLLKLLPFLLVFTGINLKSMSQERIDYATLWKKVEGLEKKGLTKSAWKEVDNIFSIAKKQNNDAQQIKSCLYILKYRNQIVEESKVDNFFYLDSLAMQSKSPAKNILQSIQAEILWNYLQNNRWEIYNRTTLQNEASKDITTWSINKLHSTITSLYNASLNEPSVLQNSNIEKYDPILIKGENTRNIRPTLFDFLAQRALAYFTNDETTITKPAYKFIIDNADFYSPVATFIKMSIKTNDNSSNHHKALLIFQQLLAFHLNDKDKSALLDVDIQRLNFVQQYAAINNKNEIFEKALLQLESDYPDNAYAAEAMYLRANIYFNKGKQYNAGSNTDNQYEIKRAKELCEATYAKFPKSSGGINCKNLINTITKPSINIRTEKVNIPGQPFKSLIEYKNVAQLFVRIIKTTRDELNKIESINNNQTQWEKMIALSPLKSESIKLPDLNDYQEHSVEIKTDKLENGVYIMLTSLNNNFSFSNNIIARQIVHISNISYISRNEEYYVVDRNSGFPIANAEVQIWINKYDYKTYKYIPTPAEKYVTDKNGFFKLKKSSEYRSILLQIKKGNDELFLDDNLYDNSYNSYEDVAKAPVTFLFTDRAIYRPGQTVFFKGIVIQKYKDTIRNEIVTDFKTKLQLKDANDQLVKEIDLTTNNYGSYNGSFTLPTGVLNGEFTLYDQNTNSYHSIKVEEYKRPKFLTEIEKPKGTYKLNDTITVLGTAKAYAGNNIDGAKVTFRVVRKMRLPVWYYWGGYSRKGFPGGSNNETEIVNGTTTTDANGTFKISFIALPDLTIDKSMQPFFNYEVSADVTDINGETRSNTTSITVAYQALQIAIQSPEKIPVESFKNILIDSRNLNGIFEKSNINVSIYKVESPQRIFRKRLWHNPDQFIMSKDEFYKLFPYDVYSNEDQISTWKIGEKLIDKTDTTVANAIFKIGSPITEQGWYKIVASTKDKYGEIVKDEKYIQLTGSNAVATPIDIDIKKGSAEPGEKLDYRFKTGYDNIWLIHTTNTLNKKTKTNYLTVKRNAEYKTEFTATEADRGGIAIDYAFVQNNRVYSGSQLLTIPWSNKELNIEYSSFRDKTLPGSKEKYTVHISGNKKENIAAEMLATMYDASLDQYIVHGWDRPDIWPNIASNSYWMTGNFNDINSYEYDMSNRKYTEVPRKSYDRLLLSDDNFYDGVLYGYYNSPKHMKLPKAESDMEYSAVAMATTASKGAPVEGKVKFMPPKIAKDETIVFERLSSEQKKQNKNDEVQIRKNFNETAFFYPDLKTDSDGNISFEFTIPEALTKWKLMTLAHTKDLASGYTENTVVTQKPLMVQPNAPRFMREGDKMEFSAKIVNLENKELTGTATLELLDAATGKPVDGWFKNIFPQQYFTVGAGQSAAVKFPIDIPINFNSALTYRIVAKAESFSDGEEMALPVLTNRMLVTESLPLNIRNTDHKQFKFEKLLNSGASETLKTNSLTVEFTSNPVWYAVQSLPYLMEYPYECAEQTFNRYYANTLAAHITTAMPKIKAVFEQWKTTDTAALLSNLQKNEELKYALLQETPWVLEAKNESQQKKNIALLFDMVKLAGEQDKALNKLKDMQSENGGFVWFKGGPDDRYITQYIITGIGHLKKLGVFKNNDNAVLNEMIDKAIPYLDKKIKEDYDYLIRNKIKLSNNNLSYTAVQYLYMRSFYTEKKIASSTQTAYTYYTNQAKKFWLQNSKYMQGMIALSMNRTGDKTTAKAIIKSLRENAIVKEEMGMYWKDLSAGGYYWHQAPIESHALLIEAFTDIDKNKTTIDDLKTWLLKQKQTQNWKSTKATAEACYALLLDGSNWLADEKEVTITLGNKTINSKEMGTEAATGYFKTKINGEDVTANMGNIDVNIKSKTNTTSTSWGSVYWQYFENLDKITPAATPLQLVKKLFVEKNSPTGPQLVAIKDGDAVHIGDKIKVRIELRVDRDMEYVHMKDMRAACMEPVNVLSEYKWQDGLGYYESTKDASTNFFFGWLPKGTYVFEYALFVTHTGNFSNGITSIQCMYAPEFTSHSEGIRVSVE